MLSVTSFLFFLFSSFHFFPSFLFSRIFQICALRFRKPFLALSPGRQSGWNAPGPDASPAGDRVIFSRPSVPLASSGTSAPSRFHLLWVSAGLTVEVCWQTSHFVEGISQQSAYFWFDFGGLNGETQRWEAWEITVLDIGLNGVP